MRMAVAVIAMLCALSPFGGAGTARAQAVALVKPANGEKARKVKTFPAFADSQPVGHDSHTYYKMSLSATDAVSIAGTRTCFVTLQLASATDVPAEPKGQRNLDRAALRAFQANLDKIVRVEKRFVSPLVKHSAYQYIEPTRLILPGGVELFLHLGTGADAKPDHDNQWSVFFREPVEANNADFGCRDMRQLTRFKRQIDECAQWLDRKKF